MRGLNDPTAIQKVDVLCYSFSPFNRLLLAASPELVPGILRQLAPAALPEYSLGEDTGLGADTQEPREQGLHCRQAFRPGAGTLPPGRV